MNMRSVLFLICRVKSNLGFKISPNSLNCLPGKTPPTQKTVEFFLKFEVKNGSLWQFFACQNECLFIFRLSRNLVLKDSINNIRRNPFLPKFKLQHTFALGPESQSLLHKPTRKFTIVNKFFGLQFLNNQIQSFFPDFFSL